MTWTMICLILALMKKISSNIIIILVKYYDVGILYGMSHSDFLILSSQTTTCFFWRAQGQSV